MLVMEKTWFARNGIDHESKVMQGKFLRFGQWAWLWRKPKTTVTPLPRT